MGCIANALFPFLPEYFFEGEGAEIEKNGHFILSSSFPSCLKSNEFHFTIGNSVARGKHARSVKVDKKNDQSLHQ